MRGSLTRIVLFVAALAAVVPATAGAQEPAPPSGGATAPESRPALAVRPVRRRQRAARPQGALPRRRRAATRRAHGSSSSTSTPPRRRGRGRRARPSRTTARSSRAGGRAAPAASSSAPSSAARRRARRSPPSCRSPSTAAPSPPGTAPASTATRPPAGSSSHRELVGVAHRSLPCGTNVAVRYGSRTLVLPVVDRGPFGSRGALGPHRGRRAAARLHAHGPHRRGPRARLADPAGSTCRVEIADDPVRHRRQARRGMLHRQRAIGEQPLDAFAERVVGTARQRGADLRRAPHRARVERPDRLEGPLAVGPARGRARLLPGEQARAVAGGVDDDRPLVAERAAGLERASRRSRRPR